MVILQVSNHASQRSSHIQYFPTILFDSYPSNSLCLVHWCFFEVILP